MCRRGSAVGGQPGGEITWAAAEVEQCFCQRLQLLQRQCLDAGRGGIAEGAAAAGQLPQGHLGGFPGFAARFAEAKDFLGPALGEVLNGNTSAATGSAV